ncbi:DUF4250 domain-containing protein [Edwardsiella ictaluri]|uniref:DUF4250 domain-containing protein n=1 Tax=Edwardsiella ictaluri TaxID=67780 RepID=UPI0009BD7212|nr:DUF4250 domain-containing protein [Edwardsiella ictaluri]ARD38792.1 hypothetical protein B6E78_04755 [Edwardsiella ictaluri]QPW27215.1 DUF4250 domain-containing protein [Edwardsiella ictaluri]
MPLSRYATMEPLMLLSIINMKLRDECDSLQALCARYAIPQPLLESRLGAAGFRYHRDSNQFSAH